MRWTRVRPRVAYAAFAALHLATAVLFVFGRPPGTDAALSGLPLDDAWIHLVYARNLAYGHGFAYNPGELEAGFSSPLHALLLVPAVWAEAATGVSVVIWVKVLGVAVGILTSILGYRALLALGAGGGAAWLAGALIAVDPSLAFAQVSGMEVLLAAATVLFAIERLASRRWLGAGLALALAPLARPENALFAALGALGLGLLLARERASIRRWAAGFAPLVVAAVSWCGYCLAVTGRWLPNTFYAKARGVGRPIRENFNKLIVGMLMDVPWMAFGAGLLLAALGTAMLLKGAARMPSARKAPGRISAPRVGAALLVAHVPLFLTGIGFVHALLQAKPFYWNRYFQPVLPPLLLLIAVGIATLVRTAVGRTPDAVPVGQEGPSFTFLPSWPSWRVGVSFLLRPPAVALALALTALAAHRVPGQLGDDAILFAWNCQNINELNVAVGRWLADHAPPEAWIATHDAGAIRYWSGRRVLDILGLNSHRVLREGPTAEVLRVRPSFFVAFPAVFPALARNPSLEVAYRARVSVLTICRCPQEELIVWRPRAPELREAPQQP